MKYNVFKLQKELESAGLPVGGVSSTESGEPIIFWKTQNPLTQAQTQKLEQIKQAHKEIDNQVEREKEMPSVRKLLLMLYWDKKKNTNKFESALDSLFQKYPLENYEKG